MWSQQGATKFAVDPDLNWSASSRWRPRACQARASDEVSIADDIESVRIVVIVMVISIYLEFSIVVFMLKAMENGLFSASCPQDRYFARDT